MPAAELTPRSDRSKHHAAADHVRGLSLRILASHGGPEERCDPHRSRHHGVTGHPAHERPRPGHGGAAKLSAGPPEGACTVQRFCSGRLYISALIENSAIHQSLQAAGKSVPSIGLVNPDKLADKLWAMQKKGRPHEAAAPAAGKVLARLMATAPVQKLMTKYTS